MMDTETLDNLIPLPTQDDLKNEITTELSDAGFTITNFKSGGIFYTIVMIFIKIYIELITLARTIVSNSTITNATEYWLEVKAKDFSKERKDASYTEGYLTLKREDSTQNITIAKGNIFKTEKDTTGVEYRYISQETTIFEKDSTVCKIYVKAEKQGAAYNLSENMITKSLTHIETVTEITNDEDWISTEGSDEEAVESFRSRVLNSWSELSTYAIADKYKNIAESVIGVLYAQVDDQHPRGQGTVDIIITGTAGEATENLLNLVSEAVEEVKGPYDNLLIKSSEVVYQDIEVVLEISSYVSSDGMEAKATTSIKELMEISTDRELNKLYRSDLNYQLRKNLDLRNVKVVVPAEDIELAIDKVIVLGNLQVTINRV